MGSWTTIGHSGRRRIRPQIVAILPVPIVHQEATVEATQDWRQVAVTRANLGRIGRT